MKILKGILSESKEYYLDAKKKIERKIKALPKGVIKERYISKNKYYYQQYRCEKKIVHKYLGKEKPVELIKQIKERKMLIVELRKVNEALKVLSKMEKKKHV